MSFTKAKPLFFLEQATLLDTLSDIPHSQSTHSLVVNYLDFYSLNLSTEDGCAEHQIWRSKQNHINIVEQYWKALNPNGKHIFLCHGYFDHTGLYGNVIRWALTQGFNVHSFDLPGHGLSGGIKASIDSFDDYSDILLALSHRENYTKLTYLGQSTGCAIIINALLNPKLSLSAFSSSTKDFATPLPEKLILLAPLVRSIHWQYTRWAYLAINPFLTSLKRTFLGSSHDLAFNNFIQNKDPLQSQRLPLKWLGAKDLWVENINTFTPNANLDCLIIQGTSDGTVDYVYNVPTIQRCFPINQVCYILDGYHHLANESLPYWNQVRDLLDLHHKPK